MQCRNSLKQLVLAMHNYADTYNHFPAGTVENDDLEVEERLSWMVSILPYLEQAQLYNQINMKEGFSEETNSQLLGTSIPAYLNPSVPTTGNVQIFRNFIAKLR